MRMWLPKVSLNIDGSPLVYIIDKKHLLLFDNNSSSPVPEN